MQHWNNSSNCYQNNWLYKKDESFIWSLTPYIEDDVGVFWIDINAITYNIHAFNEYSNKLGSIYPTLYLKSDVQIVGGDGTIENSYELSL